MSPTPPSTSTQSHSPRMWRLVLAYDGTDFQGWQVQPGLRTIQGTLAAVVHSIFGVARLPQGSGRTDAGVHAAGQVVSLELPINIPPDRLREALNRRLPASIRVFSAQQADPYFHARANVLSKTYEYRIHQRRPANSAKERICPPTLARFAWDCRWTLDRERMQSAAETILGTHDFSAFAAADPDRTQRMQLAEIGGPTNIRTIFRSTWSEHDGLLVYEIAGSGFLHHMVRNLVGTFVEVGAGRRGPLTTLTVLHSRNRALAGPTAPPQGLFLMRVDYAQRAASATGEAAI